MIGAAGSLAWYESGSIAARDWLAYALLAGLLLATILVAGRVYLPARLALVGIGGLVALAGWTAVALAWSPLPTLGREEVLLVTLYAIAFAIPVLLLRRPLEKELVLGAVVAGLGLVAIVSAVKMTTDPAQSMFFSGRLFFPVSYVNGNAAFFLVGFWPAIVIGARRAAPVLVRAAAVAAAAAFLAGWLATQSKGAGVALVSSAIVFFALAGSRVRALVPTLIAAAIAAAASDPLTSGYRAEDEALVDAARDTGRAWLIVTALAFAAAIAYALVDRRVTFGPRVRRAAGAVAIVALVAALAGGVVGFFVTVDDPGRYVRDRIDEFTGPATGVQRTTHFTTLESYRYDSWRVALQQFRDHPVAGIGSRGFYAAYLEHGQTVENPARAHSLPLDVLSETGVVGLAFLLLAVGAPLAAAVRDARVTAASTACVAACVFWLVHASVDWLWTLPANGLVFFSLLGVAAAGSETTLLGPRPRLLATVVTVAVSIVVFAPAWLSTVYLERALREPVPAALTDLDRARTLDPISTTPYVVESQLLETAGARVSTLEKAVAKETRSAGLHLLLGLAYRDAGRRDAARRELELASQLAPRDEEIQRVLRELG